MDVKSFYWTGERNVFDHLSDEVALSLFHDVIKMWQAVTDKPGERPYPEILENLLSDYPKEALYEAFAALTYAVVPALVQNPQPFGVQWFEPAHRFLLAWLIQRIEFWVYEYDESLPDWWNEDATPRGSLYERPEIHEISTS